MASNSFNIISVCSGWGGLDLAVGLAVKNAVTVCHVEREAQAAAGLAARMADGSLHEALVWSDLSTFDGKPFRGSVDCIISGDPCQPNSVAGSQLGADDDRFLIDELIRVIGEVRPSIVFRENVTGNADGQLAALVPALEAMGYIVAVGIFSAGEVGASHRRERLFLMAQLADVSSAGWGKGQNRDSGGAKGHRSQGRAAGSAVRGRTLENTEGQPRRLRNPIGRVEDFDAGRRVGELGDTASSRISKRGSPSMGQSGANAKPERSNSELAQPNGPDIQGKFAGLRDTEGREKSPRSFRCLDGTGLATFAPGPSNPAWPSILEAYPFLAPSLSTLDIADAAFAQAIDPLGEAIGQKAAESVFRRVVDGLADRVDRLRGGGNGVCPMAGAIAFLSLAAHFEPEGLE